MKNIFSNFLKGGFTEPEFITTQGISYHLEKMFKEAEQQILLISPYIKINLRLHELLHERKAAGISITIIHREDFFDRDLATQIFKRSNLHSKCYLTEKAGLLGSMNLYDYSQVNNDEMGVYFTKNTCPHLYEQLFSESERLCKNFPDVYNELKKGSSYSFEDLRTIFGFIDEHRGGIKETRCGSIVLICKSNSAYKNEERNGVLYYQGQNTGPGPQQLIYGNKLLFECYKSKSRRIFLFKDDVFCGEQYIYTSPFQKEEKWVFPLKEAK